MRDPESVIAGVCRALRPRGRFVAEMGGYGCVETIKRALIEALDRRGIDGRLADPWYFPTVEDYAARLTNRGFTINYIALIPRPTPLPGDVTAWLETFAQNFTAALAPVERPAYLAEVQQALRPKLCDAAGKWTADYVRLRFAAEKNERFKSQTVLNDDPCAGIPSASSPSPTSPKTSGGASRRILSADA
jgi:hypothetical protein